MVFNKKKKAVAPAPPEEEAEWTGEEEEGDNKDEQIAELRNKLAQTEAETKAYNKITEEIGEPQAPTQPVDNKQRARVRQVIQRDDGIFETVIESNYVFANTGDNL